MLLAAASELAGTQAEMPEDPFSAGPWRPLGAVRLRYRVGERDYEVEAERTCPRRLRLDLEDREATVEVLSAENGRLHAVVDGEPLTADFASDGHHVLISLNGEGYTLAKPPPPDVDRAGPAGTDAAGASLTAPMPGTVVRVSVSEGEVVEEGQLLLVLEAMKMEQSVKAPHAGRVSSLPYGEGDLVPGGAVLAEIEEKT